MHPYSSVFARTLGESLGGDLQWWGLALIAVVAATWLLSELLEPMRRK